MDVGSSNKSSFHNQLVTIKTESDPKVSVLDTDSDSVISRIGLGLGDSNLIPLTFIKTPKSQQDMISPVDSEFGFTNIESCSNIKPTSNLGLREVKTQRNIPLNTNLNRMRPFTANDSDLFSFAVPMVPKVTTRPVTSGSLGLNIFANSHSLNETYSGPRLFQTDNDSHILETTYTDEKFVSAEAFTDTMNANDWDILLGSNGTSVAAHDNKWDRQSLFQSFDPLNNVKLSSGQGQRSQVNEPPQFDSLFVEENDFGLSNGTGKSENTFMVMEDNVDMCMEEFEQKQDLDNKYKRLNFETDNVPQLHEKEIISIGEDEEAMMEAALEQQHLNFEAELQEKDARIQDLENSLAQIAKNEIVNQDFENKVAEYKEIFKSGNQQISDYEWKCKKLEVENGQLKSETTQLRLDLENVEHAFNDVHQKYARVKTQCENSRINEDALKQRDLEMQEKIVDAEAQLVEIKEVVQNNLQKMYQTYESRFEAMNVESCRLRAQLRKAEMKMETLENDSRQKSNEIVKLRTLCDELINTKIK